MCELALLVVDMQRDFVVRRPGGPGLPSKFLCYPAILRLLDHARGVGWKVVHVHTAHRDGGTLPRHLRARQVPVYCQEGTDLALPLPDMSEPTDSVVKKRSFSAFIGTGLSESLEGVDQIVVTGIAANCCIFLTAFDASTRLGKEVYIPLDAVSASDLSAYLVGLRSMAASAAAITTTETVIGRKALDVGMRVPLSDVEADGRAWYEARSARIPEIEPLIQAGKFAEAAELIGQELPPQSINK